MKVFLPIATEQILLIRSRSIPAKVDLSLRHKLTDTTTSYANIIPSFNKGYLRVPLSHSFVEGESYEITVTTSGSLVWRGKAFITAQTPKTYKIFT